MISRRTVIFTATIYTAIFIVGFGAGEAYLRLTGASSYVRTAPGEYHNKPEGVSWAQPDAYFGWTGVRSGPDTNAQGFRDNKEFSDLALDGSARRVMILGDSFMYGAGSPRELSVPHLLNERLEGTHEVFNVAVPGWGIDQMYLAYERYKGIIKPRIVILAFIDDDISRVLQAYREAEGMNKPSFKLHNGELELRTTLDVTSPVMNKMMKHSRLLSLVIREAYLSFEARPLVSALFSKMAQESLEEGARFVVLRIPGREQSSLSGKVIWHLKGWRRVIRDIGAEYLDPLDDMSRIQNWGTDFYIEDGHLSAAGNKHLASFIYRHIFQDRAEVAPPSRCSRPATTLMRRSTECATKPTTLEVSLRNL